MSSMYLSQMRQNPQYQNVSALDLGRMVYEQDPELQQITFDQFMPLFNDTGEQIQAQPVMDAQQGSAQGIDTDWGQVGLDSIDAAQSGFLNAASGLAEGVGGIYKWATGEESETAGNIAGFLRDQADDQMDQMSESGKAQMQNTGVDYSSENGLSMTKGSTLVGGILNVASGVGSSLPYMVPGGLGAKVLSQSGRAVGGLVMPSVARKAALNLPAGKIPMAASMAAVGGTGIGGETKNQAYEMAYNAPVEELNKTPAYQAAYWKIADTYKAEGAEVTHAQIEEQARTAVAEAAGDDAFADGFSLGAVSMGALGPMFLNNVLGRVSGGIIKRASKGAAIEGTQELVESGGQTYFANKAVNENANSSVQPMDNVISQAATGALFGAGTGGSMSAVGGLGAKALRITTDKDMPGYGAEQELLFKEQQAADRTQSESDEALQSLDEAAAESVVEEEQDLVGDTDAEATQDAPTVDPEAPARVDDPLADDGLDATASPVEESPQMASYRSDLQMALEIAEAESNNFKLTKEKRLASFDRIGTIKEELRQLDEDLAATQSGVEEEATTPSIPASNPAITKRLIEWSKVQLDKSSDSYDEQRVLKDTMIRELKSLMKAEVGSEQAFRIEDRIRTVEERFNGLAPTPVNEVPRWQQALDEEDAATEAQLQEYGQMEAGTVNVYDATGKPYSARVVRVSDQGTTVVENQAGEEVILGMDLSALDVNANDPNYKVNAKGSKYNDATISSLSDAELTELIGDETALEGGGSRVTVDSITNINAAKLELRKRDSNLDQETAPTGDNLYDVFANQETNPFASTDLFGRLQPIEEDGIAVDLQGVVRDNMNSLRANGTPDNKKLNRTAVNKILTKDTEYINSLTKTSAINNTVRRQYRKINNELGKASADYYIQSLGRAMGLFSSPTPTKLALYNEYVDGVGLNVEPLPIEVWDVEVYQKGNAPNLTAKKPKPVEAPVENLQSTPVDIKSSGIEFDISNIKRPNGAIGTQGVTEDNIRDLLRGVVEMVVSDNASMRDMVDLFKADVKAQQRLRDFTAKNPVGISSLPDGTYSIDDGHHRAFLLDQIGDLTISANVAGDTSPTTDPDPTPPKKPVPKADTTTDASAKTSAAAGKKSKGNKAVLEELDGGVSLAAQADPVQNPQANDLFEGNTDVNEVEDPVSTNEVVDSSPDDPAQDTTEVVAKEAAEVEFDLKDVASTSNNDPSDLVNDDRVLQYVTRGDGLKLALYVGKQGTDGINAQVYKTQDEAVAAAKVLEEEGLGLYRPTASLGLFGKQKGFVLDALIPAKKFRTDEPMVYSNKGSADHGYKTIKSYSAYDVHKSQVSDQFYVVTSVSRMDTVGKSEVDDSTDGAVTEFQESLQAKIENSGKPYVLSQYANERYPNQPQIFPMEDKKDPLLKFIQGDSVGDLTKSVVELLDAKSEAPSAILISAVDFATQRIDTINAELAAGQQRGRLTLEEGKDRLQAVSVMFESVNKFESTDNEDGSVTLMGDTTDIKNFLSSNKLSEGIENVFNDGDAGLVVGIKVPEGNAEKVRGKLKSRGLYLVDGEIAGAVHVVNPTKALLQAKDNLESPEVTSENALLAEANRTIRPETAEEIKSRGKAKATQDFKDQIQDAADELDVNPNTEAAAKNNLLDEGEVESETTTVTNKDPIAEFLGETTSSEEEFAEDDWGDLDLYEDNYETDPADATADQEKIDQLLLGLKDAKSNAIDTTLNAADRKTAKTLIPKIEKALAALGVVVKKSKPVKSKSSGGLTSDEFDNVVNDALGFKYVSRSQLNNTDGMSVEAVQSVIDKFEAKYNGIPDIKYMVANVPLDGGQASVSGMAGGMPTGSFDAKNKLVTLNSAGLNNVSEVESVLRHEILAHYGLSVFPTLEERMGILTRVSKAEGQNEELTKIFTEVRSSYKTYTEGWKKQGVTDEGIEALIAEEVFARVAEEKDQSVFGQAWDAIVSYVMKALRKVGFYDHYTKADVRRTLQSFGKKFTETDVETSLQVNGQVKDIKFHLLASEDGLDDSMEAILANVDAQTKIRVAADAARAKAIEAVLAEQVSEQRSVIVAEAKPSRNLGVVPTERIATDKNLAEGRKPAVEVRPDLIPDRAKVGDHSSVYADSLDAGQRMGVDLAMTTMMEKGAPGFLLADGTGFGKTRQILAMADQYRKSTGKKVLIMSEKAEIFKKNFADDAAAMGIDMKQFKTGTYTGFKDSDRGNNIKSEFDQDWGMVIFDEAHNLKNYNTIQAKAARMLSKEKVVYVTATPMDRPSAGAYMWADITGRSYEEALDRLGMRLVDGKKVWNKNLRMKVAGLKEVQLKKGVSPKMAIQKVAKMRDSSIKSGRMIKRYYPFFGTSNDITVQLTEEARNEQDNIDQWWSEEMANMDGNPKFLRGQRIMELVRWEEHLKLDATVEQVKEDIASGKQVVVAAETVSDELTIKGLDDKKIMGFIGLIKGRLDSEGIGYTELTGKSKNRDANVAAFQEGQVPVVVMTAASGGTGINLDDTVGDTPRSLIMVTKNWSGDKVVQLIGRVSRKNTQSPSVISVVTLEGGIGDKHKSAVVNRKLNTLLSSSGEPTILDDLDNVDWTSIKDSEGNNVADADGNVYDLEGNGSGGATPTQLDMLEVSDVDGNGSAEVKPEVKPTAGDNYMEELKRHGTNPTTAETAKGKKYLSLTSLPANTASIEATLRRILPKQKNGEDSAFATPKSRNGLTFFYVWQTAHAKQIATDLNDRGVVYSRQSVSENARGLSGKSVKDIEKWVGQSTIDKMRELGHKVEVVQSVADIPTAGIDPAARGLFIPNSMTSYLVADNIHSKAEARTVFSHEVVGHYGIQSMLGDEFNSVLDAVQDMKANGDPEVVAAAEVVMNREGKLSREQEAEEIIAVLAEGLESRSLMTRVYDAIRMWMKRTFASNYIASNGNLRDLVLDAKRHVYSNKANATATPQTASQILYSKVSKMDVPKQMEVFADLEENVHKTLGGLAKDSFRNSTVDSASGLINQNKTRNFLQYWLTNTQIFRTYKAAFDWKEGNPLKKINDLLGEFRVDKERALHGFEKEEKIWDKLSSKEANSLASLMRDSTIAGIHPDASMANEVHEFVRLDQKKLEQLKAKPKKTKVDVENIANLEESLAFMQSEHTRLRKEWNKLTANAKLVYDDTRVMLREQYEMEQSELLARIDRQIENPVHRESAKKALTSRMGDLIKRGPYFPLSRFGNHVVIAFAEINGKKEFVREQFESPTEAKRALKWHKEKWGEDNARMTYMADMGKTAQSGDLFSFRDNLFTALDENRDGVLRDERMDENARSSIRASTEQLKNEINDLMLNTLPSSSIMQRRRHRHGTKGASSDMRRSVQNMMLQSAQQISKIKYADRIRSELNDIGIENRKFATGEASQVKQQYADIVSATHAEMSKRFELTMNPTGAAWASNAGRLAFFHYLGWSPAAAFVNLTQVPAIAIPIVGARYGLAKTSAVFLKTMTDWHLGKSELSLRDAYKSFSRDGNKNVTADEQNFIKVLIDRGDIDITRVGSITEEAHSDQRTPSVFGTKMQKLMRTGAYMFHGAEMSNREVTGLATYRLIKDKHPELFKGSTFKSSEEMSENEHKIYDEVRELIGETQFLYESENRPRAMRENNIVKTMTTFKIYGQHVIYMYSQLAREALGRDKSLSPEKRREAMKALAGLVAFQMLAAGATGVLPIAVTVWMAGLAYNLFADDEDEIVSSEVEFTQWLDDIVRGTFDEDEQQFVSTLLSKGIGNALGIDMAARVSQDTNLLLMMPDRPMSSGKELYKELLLSVAGPVFGGIGGNAFNFAQDIYEGNPTNSLKSALPKVLRDGYKAVDYSQNGVKTRNDLEVIESLDTSDIVIQALGFTPEVVSSTYSRAFAGKNKSEQQQKVRRGVLGDIYTALSSGNESDVADAMKAVTKWNSHVLELVQGIEDPAMQYLAQSEMITSKTILASLKSKMIQKATAVDGVVLPKKHLYLLNKYTFGQK